MRQEEAQTGIFECPRLALAQPCGQFSDSGKVLFVAVERFLKFDRWQRAPSQIVLFEETFVNLDASDVLKVAFLIELVRWHQFCVGAKINPKRLQNRGDHAGP